MPIQGTGSSAGGDIAATYQNISEAERHAATMERSLEALESKLNAFLKEHGIDVDTEEEKEEKGKEGEENKAGVSAPSGTGNAA